MSDVNYFVLGELFSLLERIELIDHVAFADFDPDDEGDVEVIARKFIEPSINEAAPDNREAIIRAIAYYSATGSAPFQAMKDRCQELTLPDADSWPQFFHRVAVLVFGKDYRQRYNVNNLEERPDLRASERVLGRA